MRYLLPLFECEIETMMLKTRLFHLSLDKGT